MFEGMFRIISDKILEKKLGAYFLADIPEGMLGGITKEILEGILGNLLQYSQVLFARFLFTQPRK